MSSIDKMSTSRWGRISVIVVQALGYTLPWQSQRRIQPWGTAATIVSAVKTAATSGNTSFRERTKQCDVRRPELWRNVPGRDWRRRRVTVLDASFGRIQVGESGRPFGGKDMNGGDLIQDRQVDVVSGAGEDSRIVPQSSGCDCGEADGAAQDVVNTRWIGGLLCPG